MVKVSELLSKQLICLDTATIEGTICNITFDTHLSVGKCLELFCEDESSPEKKFVQLKNVTSLNQDAAIVKSSDSIFYEWQAEEGGFNPINCLCYNSDGGSLGTVRDIILEGTRVEKIVLTSCEFTPKELLSYSDNLLIFNDTGKLIKLARPKPKMPKPVDFASATLHYDPSLAQDFLPNSAQNSAATIDNIFLAQEAKPTATTPVFIPPQSTKVLHSPQATPNTEDSYKFLLGKVVHLGIADNSGKIIIPENITVTPETITTARACGKIVQLALRAY